MGNRHTVNRTLRIDARYVALALLILSAAIVGLALWLGLAFLFSLREYVPVLP